MNGAPDPTTPVIVGVGQALNRDDDRFPSPIDLMELAAAKAGDDAGAKDVLSRIDTVAAAPVMSWRYINPGRELAHRLGSEPNHTMYPLVGGNTPQMLMNRICERIRDGHGEIALLAGAEAVRSKGIAKRAGIELDWERQDSSTPVADYHEGSAYDLAHPSELEAGVIMPIITYPMFENALAHREGRSAAEQVEHISLLWEGFSAVASTNPHAWDRHHYSASEIATTTVENRMVGFPYNVRMVANQRVDMGSAVLVMSASAATDLGVARDRWVFPTSGADGRDPTMSERPDYVTSAAMRIGGAEALRLAGRSIEDISHLDIYSCFPSAVEIACDELSIDPHRPLTVWGGLCFGGGPWNNPVGHAIASMVDTLRGDPHSAGLVTANGGSIQKHSFGVYTTDPPPRPFEVARPQDRIDAEGSVEVETDYSGVATIETWTVMARRDGSLDKAHAILRTPENRRCWGESTDVDTMAEMTRADMVGRAVTRGPGLAMSLS